MINTDIIAIFWLIFLIVWVVSAFFAKKSVVKRRWKWRGVVIIAIVLAVVFLNKSRINLSYLKFFFTDTFFAATSVISVIAIVSAGVGLVGAVWARVYLGRNWSGYVTYKKKHELVTNGPYKYVRHPIYSSMLLMFIGTWLSFPTAWVSTMFVIYISIFLWRKDKEEAIMIKLFGKKYKDYMKHTKAIIPGVY